MMKLMKSLEKSKCPVCGLGNNCAVEQGKSISACWCIEVRIDALISSDSCVCRHCAKTLSTGGTVMRTQDPSKDDNLKSYNAVRLE